MLDITDVEVECDAMLVVQAIHKGTDNLLEVGSILRDCIALFWARFMTFTFSGGPRTFTYWGTI